MVPSRSLPATILCLVICASIFSQAPAPDIPTACNEEFAKFLVDQQVSESRTVEETDKRIRILVRAADFIWKHDQPTAREYFTEAFKVAGERFSEKGFEKKENKGLLTILPDYRFEVINSIARKDGEWAKRLIDQLMKEYEKTAADRPESYDRLRELDEILRLATDLIKTNPELSRQLYRKAMQFPLDFQWFWSLYSAARLNKPVADQLYSELLTNYANANPRRLLFLSAYPFAAGRPMGADKFNFGASIPDGMAPDRNLQSKFIDVFLRRASSYASDPANLDAAPDQNRSAEPVYIITALADLEPIIIRDFAVFIQRHSEARAQANGMLSDAMKKNIRDRDARNDELGWGFERRLKELEKADSEGKLTDFMIVSLLTWGESKTDEQLKQIEPWLDKINEAEPREASINYFWFMRAQLAIKEARFDDADRFARKVPEVEHRAILFFEIADKQLGNLNDAASVYTTLREVGRLAEQAEDSIEKARVLLALANKYQKINPVFAMQELSDSIKVFNRLENPNLLTNSVTRQIRGKDFSHFTSYSMPGYNLEGTFREISKNNFEMSVSNAKALNDKYLRTLAIIAIATNCVDIQKKKPARKEAPPKAGSN